MSGASLSDSKELCPFCNKQLQGAPIPTNQHHMYGATHFSLKIGIYNWIADRTTSWQCPSCNKTWPHTEIATPGKFRTS